MANERAASADDEREWLEFASEKPLPAADPAFRERLRAELWELLQEVVAASRAGPKNGSS
jgi:hypothetical protein